VPIGDSTEMRPSQAHRTVGARRQKWCVKREEEVSPGSGICGEQTAQGNQRIQGDQARCGVTGLQSGRRGRDTTQALRLRNTRVWSERTATLEHAPDSGMGPCLGSNPGLPCRKAANPGIGQRTLHDRLTKPTRSHPPVLALFYAFSLPKTNNAESECQETWSCRTHARHFCWHNLKIFDTS
jgi:hypothetical protein